MDDFDGGYDGFGRDDDYNIWEENELFRDEQAERESEADESEETDEDPAEDSYLDSHWEDQNECFWGGE